MGEVCSFLGMVNQFEVHSRTGRISPSSQRKIIPEFFYSDNGPQSEFVDFAGSNRLNTNRDTYQ